MSRTYIDTKDTAKLVRLALKESFPGVKFSVTIDRYSMGSSIYVSWTDGPATKAVEAVVYVFKSDYYDGMTDYHGHTYHTLDGQPVHFSGSLSVRRQHSPAAKAAMQGAWMQLGIYDRDQLCRKLDVYYRDRTDDDGWHSVLSAWDFYGQPALPSATCARVADAGDDGCRGSYGSTPEPTVDAAILEVEKARDERREAVVYTFPTSRAEH